MVTLERVRELLAYDPETGVFRWKVARCYGGRIPAGSIAGKANGKYRCIGIDGMQYREHRLAWFYMHGLWPNGVDHINGDGADNRFANLRDVSQAINAENQRRARSDNKIGVLGVSKYGGKFAAQITVRGRHLHLGYFTTPSLAQQAYLDAKRKLHAGCTI